ncbi:MAG: hypothetical protein JNN32_13980 [Flavobacteriales bacterium]|nr:hypothetical protein [Flavobacteriales bacterium]
MSERTGGRYCGNCQHEVADLTTATDDELLRIFDGDLPPPTCARFDPRQLDRVLRPMNERTASKLPVVAFTTLLAMLGGNDGKAQHGVVVGKTMPTRVERTTDPYGTRVTENVRAAGPRIITIRGLLVNATTGHPVNDGFVRIWGGEREIQSRSDPSGQFTITFEAKADSAELFFGGPDRDPFTQFVSWANATNTGPITIDMGEVKVVRVPRVDHVEMMLGEVAVQRRPTWRLRSSKP